MPGTTVDVTTADGIADAYLARPDGDGPFPAVLFYMDAFGLRPHLTAMADRLAAAGYVVLVPNVFYRAGRTPLFDLPDFIDQASRPALFEKIIPVMQSLTPAGLMSDAGAYLRYLADLPFTTDGPVGVTGYCMGAGVALRTAATYPDRVAAAAGFHGANLASEAPDSPHLVAGSVTAELYFAHADQDAAMPQEQIDRLEKALTEAGVTHRCEVYEGAHHGYTQSDTSAYDAEAAERHWSALLALFGRTLS
ncbi:dienelactone hydrolase family protein [Lentzea sp. NBRC 102530]|uniref:dienelactone hydrolase family protein n=1 Tax=Lentzea sp. NBRC 102530 TaxID=3032201 RepID=UPI0024A35BDF|nr:dienelactone hydrolase family protein [Lentzea sp. NBRC 102530]GLY50034.1 hydrolase [Lentzea sp. NBRC 102530]